ncbi:MULTISPECIES: DUF456 domain-containing protein [unclassified Streptomyces]|uniref:DUF456 domain-containing protein n=1 Tax=unclassified Streptomyces TaxID=2593676 RepID=UPI002DDB8BC8|nr:MULTISPECIES: DUF456 domain-containing protein [unclassified Streptomyces]WSA79831.1 DUF456 domain-containing protein [Streptomyces sp. NBC_01799]WSF83755.1 DUF456 domain-containing protein [Streptomyces sp. NBC_01744]WSA71320.1 DUF456 domain-containing protein [Streptomyces sp. NBC_01800]WSC39962.1 DUF456 domain-containing protein [Streptomyces sp. NBC_01763]WSC48129.1 DUF456 domain-containing protein [Streptomyces sp. NBC_01762]
MGVWQLIAVGLVILLGLVGVLVPGVPGQAIVWAAVLWWALTDRSPAAWGVLIGATVLLLLNQALKPLLRPRRPRESGAPRKTLMLGGIAGIVGFFVLPVVGGIVGYVGAIYGAERLRLGSGGAARASLRSVMRATGYSVLVELFACLLVTGAWLVVVIRS